MGFNYAREKLRFDAEWHELEAQYREAGMDETGIQAMRELDWELFKQRRTYENREQAFPSEVIDNSDSESLSKLLQKFPALTVGLDEYSSDIRYGWIDAINDHVLSDKLYALSDEDKELLTLLAFDGYTQTEIAKLQGCVQSVVSRKISRLKKYLS